MKKILIINYGGLGDQILFLPTIKTIKSAYPDSEITFVTEPRSGAAEKITNLIDKTIICDIKSGNKIKNILGFLTKIWGKGYDIVISSGSSQQVAILLFLTGIKTRIGFYSGKLSKLLLSKTAPLNQQQYAVKMYHSLAEALVPNSSSEIPQVFVPEEAVEKLTPVIKNTDKPVIVIHPGVSKLSIQKNILKFWDVKNWTELIKRLLDNGKYKVVLTGGNDDKEVSEALKQELGEINNENYMDFTNKTANISELVAIIKLADAIVCVDSAPMHIGVGVNTPTVALFGPTDEDKLFPYDGEKFISITAENLECRPCLWDKRKVSCENPVCLDIPVDRVIEAVEKIFS
jgi:lipopolysaccharide heptosyltransferase II